MRFPLEKYTFYMNGARVIAVSTYAGKIVRGVAKCSNKDEFSAAAGKEIAAARCNVRVCRKRKQRAMAKYNEAYEKLAMAQKEFDRMSQYLTDSQEMLNEAIVELEQVEKKY